MTGMDTNTAQFTNDKPTLEEILKAEKQGYDCAEVGMNENANAYRHKGHTMLYQAWLKGHKNYNPAVDHEQDW